MLVSMFRLVIETLETRLEICWLGEYICSVRKTVNGNQYVDRIIKTVLGLSLTPSNLSTTRANTTKYYAEQKGDI